MTELLDKLAFNKNNNSKPVFRKNNGNNKVNRFSVGDNNVEYTKKSRKVSKLGKLKSEKLTQLRKKLSKSENLSKFYTKEAKSSFLTSDTKITFNRL